MVTSKALRKRLLSNSVRHYASYNLDRLKRICEIWVESTQLTQFLFYLVDFSCYGFNDLVVGDVAHWLVACGTLEEKLKSFLEGKSFAAGRFAAVKFVAFLIPKPSFKFFKNASLLVKDEAFQLVGLESPVEDKPTCFFVAGPPESHKGVVVESIEYLTN